MIKKLIKVNQIIKESKTKSINNFTEKISCSEDVSKLVSDEELEKVFGGNSFMRARWTFTSKCPSSIGHCC